MHFRSGYPDSTPSMAQKQPINFHDLLRSPIRSLGKYAAFRREYHRLRKSRLFSDEELERFAADYETFRSDYLRLRESGLFLDEMYSRRYLDGADPWLSLPHYLLTGETRRCLPNPFFDPDYFGRRSGTRRLVDYLDQIPLWAHQTSPYFDSAWYVDQHFAELSTAENPLLHFWQKGFDLGYNPSPRFDMEFFRRAIARDYTDKRRYAFEYLSACDPDAPLNLDELEKRQSDFYRTIELETLKSSGGPRRPFLVFLQSGRNFIPGYDYEAANFDMLINYYDESTRIGKGVRYVFRQAGTKATAVAKLLEMRPEVLLGYEAVLLLDDDVTISQKQIDTLFLAREKHRLDLLQASLSEDSECYFPVLKQPRVGPGLRRVSAVEIMMPLLSRRALEKFGWVFRESVSGWGADLLISAQVRKHFGDTIAVLGDVICVHGCPVEISTGAFYRFLRRNGLEATTESGRIAMKFCLNDKMSAVRFLDLGASADSGIAEAQRRDTIDAEDARSSGTRHVAPS